MKISEVAERTGLNVSKIGFHNKSELCLFKERCADCKRGFSETDANWLILLASLRTTEMLMIETYILRNEKRN